jgi:hypothetical protein
MLDQKAPVFLRFYSAKALNLLLNLKMNNLLYSAMLTKLLCFFKYILLIYFKLNYSKVIYFAYY